MFKKYTYCVCNSVKILGSQNELRNEYYKYQNLQQKKFPVLVMTKVLNYLNSP